MARGAQRGGRARALFECRTIDHILHARLTAQKTRCRSPYSETQAEGWLRFFQAHGYAIYHRTANFIRLRFESDPGAVLPVDLMLADDKTFQKIQIASRRVAIGPDLTLAIPSALHLVAMKLHARRSPHRVEHGVDLQDVKHLIRTAKIDCSSREFAEIKERYASETIRARLDRELGKESGA